MTLSECRSLVAAYSKTGNIPYVGEERLGDTLWVFNFHALYVGYLDCKAIVDTFPKPYLWNFAIYPKSDLNCILLQIFINFSEKEVHNG